MVHSMVVSVHSWTFIRCMCWKRMKSHFKARLSPVVFQSASPKCSLVIKRFAEWLAIGDCSPFMPATIDTHLTRWQNKSPSVSCLIRFFALCQCHTFCLRVCLQMSRLTDCQPVVDNCIRLCMLYWYAKFSIGSCRYLSHSLVVIPLLIIYIGDKTFLGRTCHNNNDAQEVLVPIY